MGMEKLAVELFNLLKIYMNKICLILPANLYFAPYINIYTNLLNKRGYKYDIIYWDREGVGEDLYTPFKLKSNYNSNKFKKIIDYIKFSRFVNKKIKDNNYQKLIIFGSQYSVFASNFLCNKFKGKYIIDFRDLGIEQTLMHRFNKVLEGCKYIVLSSPAFSKYLPKGFDYIISHNFNIDTVRELINQEVSINKESIQEVLTIGGIRDFEQNSQIIEALSNDKRFFIHFVGKGIDKKPLEDFARLNKVLNIKFDGYYDKKDEPDYIKKASFMNIFYPKKPSHDTALSNRFYNSILYCRPMITTKNTIQGDFASKYGLGIGIENTSQLKEEIDNFIKNFDQEKYNKNRKDLLTKFIKDYDIWERSIIDFIENN